MLVSRNYNKNIVKAAITKAKLIPRIEALKRVTKKENNRVVFAITFNPRLPSVSGIIVKHWRTMTKDKKMLEMFPKPPMVAFKQPPNLKNMLCKAKLPVNRGRPQRIIPGMKECKKCPMCIHVDETKVYKSTQTKQTFKLKGEFTCKTNSFISNNLPEEVTYK